MRERDLDPHGDMGSDVLHERLRRQLVDILTGTSVSSVKGSSDQVKFSMTGER